MPHEHSEILTRLAIALMAGGVIGFERSYHGRPAGFRTHTLVCLASSLLMLVTVYQGLWFHAPEYRVSIDPTLMAQGIMTGIGFLGAGVIIKEGFSVRGLTTAASIWITAAIGILAGIGFYFPTAVATGATLGALSLFRWIEARMPSQFFAQFEVAFERGGAMGEQDLRALLAQQGFSVANFGCHLDGAAGSLSYQMVIRSRRTEAATSLSRELQGLPALRAFRITPTGD